MLESSIPLVDGECKYVQSFLTFAEANALFDTLMEEVDWHQPEVNLFGKKQQSPRLAAWYGDPGAVYTYSGVVNTPLTWLPCLSDLKKRIEAYAVERFNSVLLNYYRDGNDAMGWHSDDEAELGGHPTIASVSLGTSRHFLMRHKTNKSLPKPKILLDHGSLLIMSGPTQHHWRHAINRTKSEIGPRINLTFRLVNG